MLAQISLMEADSALAFPGLFCRAKARASKPKSNTAISKFSLTYFQSWFAEGFENQDEIDEVIETALRIETCSMPQGLAQYLMGQ